MPALKFSVVTPSLNHKAFLEQNIRSVLDQKSPNLEHIIVDGGSTDGTLDLLKSFPHLRWTSEPDRGQAHALNKGFRKATGDIVGWLNSDDSYAPGAFAAVSPFFEDPAVMVVYGDACETDVEGRVLRTRTSKGISERSFVEYWWWRYEYTQPSIFVRKQVFDEVGFLDEHLYYVMDHEWLIRLIRRYRFTYVPAVLSNYRLHAESKTGRAAQPLVPPSVWELHRVSRRFWGSALTRGFYRHACSFAAGILFSLIKNLFLVRGSKLREYIGRREM